MRPLAAVAVRDDPSLDSLAAELSALLAGVRRLERRLERLAGTPVAAAEVAAEFRRVGDYWSIAFGGARCQLAHRKGLGYIGQLLRCPRVDVHVLDLTGSGDHRRLGLVAPGGELVDHAARRAYRRRVDELTAEIDQAQRFNDPERGVRAREELAFIVRELEVVHGLGGRTRLEVCPAERARQSVTKAIASARGRIAAECPDLARHLEATLQTGTFCRYMPGSRDAPNWRL